MTLSYQIKIALKIPDKTYCSYRTVLFQTNKELSDNNSYLRVADAVRKVPSIINPRYTPNMGLDSEYSAMKIITISLLSAKPAPPEGDRDFDFVEEVTWIDLSTA